MTRSHLRGLSLYPYQHVHLTVQVKQSFRPDSQTESYSSLTGPTEPRTMLHRIPFSIETKSLWTVHLLFIYYRKRIAFVVLGALLHLDRLPPVWVVYPVVSLWRRGQVNRGLFWCLLWTGNFIPTSMSSNLPSSKLSVNVHVFHNESYTGLYWQAFHEFIAFSYMN